MSAPSLVGSYLPDPGDQPIPGRESDWEVLCDLLEHAASSGASDLHLADGFPPAVRVDGSIRPVPGYPVLSAPVITSLVEAIVTDAQRQRIAEHHELDLACEVPGVGRVRANIFRQRGSLGAVFRLIPRVIPPLESLGLPGAVGELASLRKGLVLLTGPTGSGKSTTLAALIEVINSSRAAHIVTIEDPIEFLHEHRHSIVNQREVGIDTESFATSLRQVLRQDPDVILIGEMRDRETIATAITAAETGHLVFATLHTQDAPQSIDRMIDVFPAGQQAQVRTQLAGALEAIVTQQLVPCAGGIGRVAVCEVLRCTPAIRNVIRSGKAYQAYSLMQTGAEFGMQTMDQALAAAVRDGRITRAIALERSRDPEQLCAYLDHAPIGMVFA